MLIKKKKKMKGTVSCTYLIFVSFMQNSNAIKERRKDTVIESELSRVLAGKYSTWIQLEFISFHKFIDVLFFTKFFRSQNQLRFLFHQNGDANIFALFFSLIILRHPIASL